MDVLSPRRMGRNLGLKDEKTHFCHRIFHLIKGFLVMVLLWPGKDNQPPSTPYYSLPRLSDTTEKLKKRHCKRFLLYVMIFIVIILL